MRIDELLKKGVASLAASSDTALLDSQLLLANVLQVSTSYLYTWPDRSLNEEEVAAFNALLLARAKGEPVAYLLGVQEFWSLEFDVSPCTLIPRSDTEVLVETALELLEGISQPTVIDMGTGTGAIALSIASERLDAKVQAVDLVHEAVELAKRNALKLQLKADIYQSSWFDRVMDRDFDLIVSNPPYIDPEDHHLDEGDVRFEPKTALIADQKGYSDIEIIARDAKGHLTENGWLAFEHGYDQGEGARKILERNGYHKIETRKDYAGNDRVTLGQWFG